ncbi:putative chitinase [Duganella sp. CF458]|uniref:glycoside hydrolase family 19 protein n=1 Tax=Duganella sp. CF458 TaxID=1884368 RepID=UPI0008EF2C21|nr:glycoside hydrolase family 19 protein [Duganella sp. CF458]SFH00804.1 putative chitinase [Duganella sp. CF458]
MNPITEQQLRTLLAASDADPRPGLWTAQLNECMQAHDISTPARQSAFLAQVLHESAGLKHLEEGLSYSAPRLRAVFGRRFTSDEQAVAYSHQPEKLANYIYADRMGNGNEASGDGWKYRGRGLIQLTGRDNYARFAAATKTDALANPDLVLSPPAAALSAAWFWSSHGLNDFADKSSAPDGDAQFLALTKRINQAADGLASRSALWKLARQVLASRPA